jgi:hypothetical protein
LPALAPRIGASTRRRDTLLSSPAFSRSMAIREVVCLAGLAVNARVEE